MAMGSGEHDLEKGQDGATTPQVIPAYPDDELRALGEELASLYDARDTDPEGSVIQQIAKVRSQMRKGPRLHAGEFIADGRYRLVERLQRGGADGYWRAWDRAHGEFVFVRVFHSEWVDDTGPFEQFLERGRALTQLVHPAIGQVLDANRSDDGFVYLVTQLFASGNLEQAADLDAVDALQVIVEAGRALEVAHAEGVVHGDVRPTNIMLSPEGSAHLVGFSVTPQEAAEMASLFRAPETTERAYQPAPPADVYALGMTAMQSLNGGELPFWVLRDPSRLIQSLQVTDSVKDVLLKATDWDLEVRYPGPLQMLEALLSDAELVEALGTRARERGRYDVAAEHGESLLSLAPDRQVEIRTVLGEVYTALGSHQQAFVHLLDAIQLAPEVEALFAPLRTVAERTGDWRRLAEALSSQAEVRKGANRVALRIELARIHEHELEDAETARQTWTQVFEDHRTPDQAATALRALQSLALDVEAWEDYVGYSTQLLDYAEDDERHRIEYGIGRVYIEHLDREALGLTFIDRAEAAGWTEIDLSTRLQQIRAQMGQWQNVIQLMVIQAESQDIAGASPTLMRAGIIATSVHLEEDAFAVYHALLERAPRHVVALRHLARMHHRAHEHDKALRYYERLWDTYRGKPADEPEASERAADCMAHAQLLLKQGKGVDAAERLEEAMRLNANHVPTLQLAGPLFLDQGDMVRASSVFERTLSLFKSVELSPQKIEAALGMGDLCWIQGRLTAAMGWYNRSIELDPFSVPGWWGLAKVALASRGGHPGADRAPWVRAIPKRYTGNEALARLFAGILSPRSTRAWLMQSAMGRALVEGGDSPMRLACGVVDVAVRNEVVDPELFSRLAEVRPDWGEAVEEVQRLWLAGGASTFPVVQSYGWSSRLVESDFDPLSSRAVLPPALSAPPVALEALKTGASWEMLFADAQPPPSAPMDDGISAGSGHGDRHRGPILGLVAEDRLWVALRRDKDRVIIGTQTDCELRIPEDGSVASRHAQLERRGGSIYVTPLDGEVAVDGVVHPVWRLAGGEILTVGQTQLEVRIVEDDADLPRDHRTPDDEARPEDVEALERLISSATEADPIEVADDASLEPTEDMSADYVEAEGVLLEDDEAVYTPDAPAIEEDDEVVQTLAPPKPPPVAMSARSDVPITVPLGGSEADLPFDPTPDPLGTFDDLPELAPASMQGAGQAPDPRPPTPPPLPPRGAQPELPTILQAEAVLEPTLDSFAEYGMGGADPLPELPQAEAGVDLDAGQADPTHWEPPLDAAPEGEDEPLPTSGGTEVLPNAPAWLRDALAPGEEDGPTPVENFDDEELTEPTVALDDEPTMGMTAPGEDDVHADDLPTMVDETWEEGEPLPEVVGAEILDTPAPLPDLPPLPDPAPLSDPVDPAPLSSFPDPAPLPDLPPLPEPAPLSSVPDPAPLPDLPPLPDPASALPDPAPLSSVPDPAPLPDLPPLPDPAPLSSVPDPAPLSSVPDPAPLSDLPPLSEPAPLPDLPPLPDPASALPDPAPLSSVPDPAPLPDLPPLPDWDSAGTPAPAPVAITPPATSKQGDATPTVVAPAIAEDVAPPASAGGVFAFPEDLQDDAPVAAEQRPLGSGISGPSLPPTPNGQGGEGSARIEFMSGPDRGRSVAVESTLMVGRDGSCGVSVPTDALLDPQHCVVERTPTGFVLRAIGSSSRTVVNGNKVSEVELEGGETIMVGGRTVLCFRLGEA